VTIHSFSLGRWLRLLTALASAATLGCGPSTNAPTAAALSQSDAAVIEALDPFNPWYLLDQQGRVVKMRLTDRHVTPAAMALVGKLTALEKLQLDRSGLTDEGLTHLKDLKKLWYVGVSGTQITDQGFLGLAKFKNLQAILVLQETGAISDAAIEKLKLVRPEIELQ
jgi:hypothetical protein